MKVNLDNIESGTNYINYKDILLNVCTSNGLPLKVTFAHGHYMNMTNISSYIFYGHMRHT